MKNTTKLRQPRMKTQEYKRILIFFAAFLILIAASPTFSFLFSHPKETFSEIWILGPDHKAETYPLEVQPNRTYSMFLGIVNHMNEFSFYIVKVKIRNQTQLPPDITNAIPSPLPSLYEFNTSVPNEKTWETTVNFEIINVTLKNNVTRISKIKINESIIPVQSITRWDSVNKGFYYSLFFELWRYDTETHDYIFDNRFVGIWLNLTNPIPSETLP